MTRMLRTRDVRPESSQTAEELSDENLLDQFLSSDQAESEEAFRTLVDRHGPMVLGVCRHVLNRHHDAEDVFQATFLVLARKGGLIRNRRVLAGWLHEVAYRMAVKARTGAVRRRAVEREGVAMLPRTIEPGNQDQEAAWNELRPVLHAEVNRLPDRYRLPVILSYLEGKTNEEVAELLEWPLGTVKGRLSCARDLLRSRLLRRGLSLAAAFLVKSLSEDTVFAEVVPVELSQRATAPGRPVPVASGLAIAGFLDDRFLDQIQRLETGRIVGRRSLQTSEDSSPPGRLRPVLGHFLFHVGRSLSGGLQPGWRLVRLAGGSFRLDSRGIGRRQRSVSLKEVGSRQ